MPIYEIETPAGQSLEIDSDSMPTAEDIRGLVEKMFPTTKSESQLRRRIDPLSGIEFGQPIPSSPEELAVQNVRPVGPLPQAETTFPQFPTLPEEPTLPDVLRQPRKQINASGVVENVLPGSYHPEELRPAVRMIGGELAVGEKGDTHPDIIKRDEIDATDLDQRGFVGPSGEFFPREQAKLAALLPDEMEPGRSHSTDLAKAQESAKATAKALGKAEAQKQEVDYGIDPDVRDRLERIAAARASLPVALEPQEQRAQQVQDINRRFDARMKMLPWETNPARARELAAGVEAERKSAIEKLGFESIEFMPKPRIGEPLTRQMEVDLFGPGTAGKAIGAAQRQVYGFAESMVQPEGMAIVPGVAAIKAVKPLAHVMGAAFIPGMAEGAVSQAAQAAGHASVGDWDSAIETGAGAAASTLMLSMPIMAAKKRTEFIKRMKAEAEDPLPTQLDRIEESIANTDPNDPEIGKLRQQRADVQQRIDLMNQAEQNISDVARESGKELIVTDESLGDGVIGVPRGGKILINREVLRKVLEIDAGRDPKLIDKVLRAVANQEVIHSFIPNRDAEDYWNSLTNAERAFEESLYPFEKNATAAQKGQEALRRRIEMANGLTPLEFLINTRYGPLKSRTLDLMARALRRTRELISASEEENKNVTAQTDIVDRAMHRLEQARKGTKDALVPETAQPVRDVRAQPPEGKGEVPAPEGGAEAGEGRREAGLAPEAQVSLAPQLKDPAQQIRERILGNDREGAQVIMDDEMAYWRDVFKKDPDFADEKVRQPIIDGLDQLQKEINEAKAPPAAQTVEGPPAAPAAVEAKPGVAAPGEPAISTAKPEVSERQARIEAIARKEKIAQEFKGEYQGTRGGKDFYNLAHKDPAHGRAQLVVPEGTSIEAIREKMAEKAKAFEEPFARRRRITEKELEAMPLGDQGKLGHPDGIEYGLSLTKEDIPKLEQKYRKSMEDFKEAFSTGKSAEEQRAAFGRFNFYGGALMGASRGEHPISGANFRDYMTMRDAVPAARRGRSHEGVSEQDLPGVLAAIRRGEVTIDGVPTEDPLVKHVATSIITDGYDTTMEFYRQKAEEIGRTLENNGVDPMTAPQFIEANQMSFVAEQLGDSTLDYGPGKPNLDINIAAKRGKWKPLGQEQLGLGLGTSWVLPGEQKADIRGREVERGVAPGQLPERPTGKQIMAKAEEMAGKAIEFGTRPSRKGEGRAPERTKKYPRLADFEKWVRDNVGAATGKSIITQMWKDAVYKDLVDASPARLAEWISALDLAKKLKLRMDPDTGKVDVTGIPGPKGEETFRLEPLAEGEKPKSRLKRREGEATVYRAGKKYRGTEEKRAQIIAAIAAERLRETMPKEDLDRRSIELQNLDLGNDHTQVGVVRKISIEEANNMDSLLTILRDEARSKGQPESHTKRLVVLLDRQTNKVHIVSTFNDAGVQKVVDPAKARVSDRPNVELDASFMRRYRPISSLLLSDPVRNFHQAMGSVGEYTTKIEKPGMEFERPAAAFAGEAVPMTSEEADAAEWEYMQRQMRGIAEREEYTGGTKVARGEGGAFMGPGGEQARAFAGLGAPGEIARSYREPLTANEVEGTLDYIHDEVGEVKTTDDVLTALDTLAENAKRDIEDQQRRVQAERRTKSRKPMTWDELMMAPSPLRSWLQGKHRLVISALQKMAERIHDQSYDPETKDYTKTPDQAYSEAISDLTRHIFDRTSIEDFTARLLSKYGQKAEEPVQVPGVAVTEPRAKGVMRELTMREPPPRMAPSRFPLPRTEPEPIPTEPKMLPEGTKQPWEDEYTPSGDRMYAEYPTVEEPPGKPGAPPTGMFRGQPAAMPFELAAPQLKPKVSPLTGKRMAPEFILRKKPEVKPFELRGEGELPPIESGKEILGPLKEVKEPAARRNVEIANEVDPEIVRYVSSTKDKDIYEFHDHDPAAKQSGWVAVDVPKGSNAQVLRDKIASVAEGESDAYTLPVKGEEGFPAARRGMPAEMQRVKDSLESTVRRKTVMRDIPRMLDGLENTSQVEAHDVISSIVIASLEKGERSAAREREAEKIRSAAIAVQSTIQRPTRREIRKAKRQAKKDGVPFEMPRSEPSQAMINGLIVKAELAMERANSLIRGTKKKPATPADKWVGNRWLKAANKLHEAAVYARDNWQNPILHDTVRTVRAELKAQIEKERAMGMNTQEFFNYLPGLYEAEIYNEGVLNWGSWNLFGKNYRQPKKFANYYDAIVAGPYIPASFDVAHIVGHRVRRGNHIVARSEWREALKGVIDPVSGLPISTEPKMTRRDIPSLDPETGAQKLDEDGNKVFRTEYGWKVPDQNHILFDPVTGETGDMLFGSRKPMAIRKGFEAMIAASSSRSAIRKYPVGRAALKMTSALKHGWILMLDSFHLGRLGQYGLAATGAKQIPGVVRRGLYAGGYSAISYRAQDIPRAVERGLVSKESADWALGRINVNVGRGRTVEVTRHQLMREMVMQGLNAGRIADAIYKDTVAELAKHIPIINKFYGNVIGPYNRFLFDHFVPGIIGETAIRNFEAMNAKHPEVPVNRLMKDIIRDTNAIYGNMGRQGLFRDATLRDLLQIVLLAPSWREGLFQKEARYIYRAGASLEKGSRVLLSKLGAGVDPSRNVMLRMTGREGLPVMGTLGNMIGRGLITYFMLAQMINLITRRKFTWQNEEEGRKLDAWIPVGSRGVWLPTLGVFGEITGDIIRYGETKGNTWQQLLQVGINSLGPVGRAANVLWTQETPMGQRLATTPSILGAAAMEVAPPPISLSTLFRGTGHMLAPGMIAPNEPGAVPQRIAGAAGLKVHRGIDNLTQISRLAKEWAKHNDIPEPTIQIKQTQEDSLSKFRHAIEIKDFGGAKRIYRNLIDRYERTPRGKGFEGMSSDEMILRAMKIWRDRPFTGSKVKEEEFRASLSRAMEEVYQNADAERMELYGEIEDFIRKQ